MAVTAFSKVKKVDGGAKKTTAHPPYAQMIKEAITSLKERSGSSQFAIAKFIEDKHKVQNLSPNFKKLILSQLKKLVANGTLIKVKSSFKLGAPAKPKVPSKRAINTKPKTAAAKPKTTATKAKKPKTTAAKPKTNVAKPKKVKKVVKPTVMKAKKVVMKVKKPKSVKSPGKKKVAATKKAKK